MSHDKSEESGLHPSVITSTRTKTGMYSIDRLNGGEVALHVQGPSIRTDIATVTLTRAHVAALIVQLEAVLLTKGK